MSENAAGWLIVHTENKAPENFPLKEGRNLIGRKTSKNNPEIPINDQYASRRHALLIVRKTERYEYEYSIADNAEALGKPSLNGTYINGNSTRIAEKSVKLKDGDTIQVGETKLVLKSAKVAVNVEDAIKLVGKTGYQKTVDFNKNSGGMLKTTIRK